MESASVCSLCELLSRPAESPSVCAESLSDEEKVRKRSNAEAVAMDRSPTSSVETQKGSIGLPEAMEPMDFCTAPEPALWWRAISQAHHAAEKVMKPPTPTMGMMSESR